MTEAKYKALMRSMGRACARYQGDLLADLLRANPGVAAPPAPEIPEGPLSPAEVSRRFDALDNPRTSADFATTLPYDDYLAELERRGLSRPEWLP
jgi:hypothetical protein